MVDPASLGQESIAEMIDRLLRIPKLPAKTGAGNRGRCVMKIEFIGGPFDGTVLEGEAAESTAHLGGYHKLGDNAVGKRVVIPPIWTRSILSLRDPEKIKQMEQEDPRVGMHLIYQFEGIEPFRLRFVDARPIGKKN